MALYGRRLCGKSRGKRITYIFLLALNNYLYYTGFRLAVTLVPLNSQSGQTCELYLRYATVQFARNVHLDGISFANPTRPHPQGAFTIARPQVAFGKQTVRIKGEGNLPKAYFFGLDMPYCPKCSRKATRNARLRIYTCVRHGFIRNFLTPEPINPEDYAHLPEPEPTPARKKLEPVKANLKAFLESEDV